MADVLPPGGIRLGLTATSREDAIWQCGAVLVELGVVQEDYPPTMLEREKSISTYIGEGVAIPHGTDAGRALVRRTTLCVLQFPDGLDWGGDTVYVCVTIAANGDEHMGVLASLAQILSEPGQAEWLRTATTADSVLRLLTPIHDDITP